MKKRTFTCDVIVCDYDELHETERQLIEAAREACSRSYSPYSRFSVGAALRLADGTIVCGSNQENAAYPSGICAERTALFHAGAQYPHLAVESMAIAAKGEKGVTETPCPPCGACRQVLLETEQRHGGHPIRILLYGKRHCYILAGGAKALLPLQFDEENLE